MSDRDAIWTIWVNKAHYAEYSIWNGDRYNLLLEDNEEDDGLLPPVLHLIDWCLEADLNRIEYETMRLASICLSWFLTSTSRFIRDRSTKALARAILAHPNLALYLLKHFVNVNDFYVLERIYAAVYGAICHGVPDEVLRSAANWIYENIFQNGKPIPHILIRDYARGVVEKAYFHNLTKPNVDISLVRPPYKSVWPIEEPSKEEIEQLVREAGADRIKSSIGVGDVGVHDFGEYTMGRVRSFKTRSSKTGMLDRDPVDKENFNGMWARKWVIKRAINFGWNQNLFNDFDRSRYVHDGERYGAAR